MTHRLALAAAALPAIAAATLPARAQPVPERIALTGARIITVAGPDIPNGSILIESGRIAAVGTDLQIPYDAIEIELDGKVVMPGMVEPHSWRGLDRANESLPVMPFLDVYDAIDPARRYFENALRSGITTVHVIQGNNTVIAGLSRAVMPIGLDVNEMTQRPDVALKLSTTPRSGFDRMRQLATLREAFADLDRYTDEIARKKYEEHLKEQGKEPDLPPDQARDRGLPLLSDDDYDDQHRNLMRLRRGDLRAFIYCGQPTDIAPALQIARDNNFLDRTVLVLGPRCHLAAEELKQAQRPVVLDADLYDRRTDPITGDIVETFVPRAIHDAGLTFALQSDPNASLPQQYLNYQAAVCVREGIPPDVALRAITLWPADMLGMRDDIGSIEPGKRANLVVLTGDPFDFNSWVDLVYINGILAYDRSKDTRLQQILSTQPDAHEEPAP